MPSSNPDSNRVTFQWKYMDEYIASHPDLVGEPRALNIGCADDPVKFGNRVRHVDLDDWSYKHEYFTQADIHDLPFPDGSYDLVVVGDVLEHVYNPAKAVSECCRVVAPGGVLVLTVFEEWKLPGHGQYITEAQKIGDEESRKLGYKDREDYQRVIYPERKGVDDDTVPHLVHINQFNDDDMKTLASDLINYGFEVLEFIKAFEATYEGHDWYNWLLAARRIT